MKILRATALGLLLLAPLCARAEKSVERPEPKPGVAAAPGEPSLLAFREARPATPFPPLWRIGAAVALIGAAGWGLSAFAARRRLPRGGAPVKLDLLAVKSLGARHRVALLEVEGRRLLVGLAGDSIRTLADLGETDAAPGFDAALERRLERERAERDEPTPAILSQIGRFEGLDV